MVNGLLLPSWEVVTWQAVWQTGSMLQRLFSISVGDVPARDVCAY